MEELKKYIRDIPDWPKPGVMFRDITPLLKNGPLFQQMIDLLAKRYQNKAINLIVSVEARGFILGGPLAYKLGAGIVPVRKPGKLPYRTVRITYELEYGTDALEIHEDAIKPGDRILIVDDILATGGTVAAVINLLKKLPGQIVEIVFLAELTYLHGREKIKDYPAFSLIQY